MSSEEQMDLEYVDTGDELLLESQTMLTEDDTEEVQHHATPAVNIEMQDSEEEKEARDGERTPDPQEREEPVPMESVNIQERLSSRLATPRKNPGD